MRRGISPRVGDSSSANGLVAQQGFNLIEIMISVAIIGVFLGIGIPAIGDWIQNRQVNVLAESIASGMRLAQTEAVQRNVPIDMVFTTSDVTSVTNPAAAALAVGGLTRPDPPNWMVRVAGEATSAGFLYGKMGRDGSENARFIGPAGVSFSPLGRLSASIASDGTATPPAGNVVFQIVNPSVHSGNGTLRCVYVGVGGAVRVCDPRAVSPDARACVPPLAAGACPPS